jgi:hypothetical protein
MTDQTMITALVVFVALASLGMLAQGIALVLMYLQVKKLSEQVTPVIPKVKQLADSSIALVTENREKFAQVAAHSVEVSRQAVAISQKASDLLDSSKIQMERFDSVWGKASEKALVNIEKTGLVVEDTVGRVHETVSSVHNGIMVPIRSISGIANGLKAAVNSFVKGQKQPTERVAQDEEMFIG